MRDPDQPSQNRQDDIFAALEVEKMPLTRPELVEKMRLKTEGKIGAHLAWMVRNGKLINILNRGYWFPNRPAPG
jgi:hypothetical protein